jgi:flagellar motor switch protein FliM
MTEGARKFDPEQWLRDDVEAEWAVARAEVRRRAPLGPVAGDPAMGAPGAEQTGIHAIVNSSLVSYERLPMLDVIFDRLVRMMTTSLRNFTSDNIEVSIDNIASVRFGDFLNDIPLPAMIGVFRAREWDNFGLLVIESELIYAVVDVLLGGRRGAPQMRVEGRQYTTIETMLVERMIDVIMKDLSAAFEPLSPVTFQFDRIETNPRFASIARPTNAAVNVRFRVDMEDRGGQLELLIPYATLEPIRELLLQRFMGEKFGRDSIWENHLATELYRTHLDVEAVLGQQDMTLADVMKFKSGQTILFGTHSRQPIELRCGGVTLGYGRMGRSGGAVAVQLTERKATRPEFQARARDGD